MTVHTNADDPDDEYVDFNPTVYLESRRGRLEIDVRRRSAAKPVTATIRIGKETRKFPRALLDGFNGIKDAFVLTWKSPDGTILAQTKQSWCPNDGQQSRLTPHAATRTAFTYTCGSHPFTRSMRWGIDRGWSRQLLGYLEAPEVDLGDKAVLELALRPELGKALRIPAAKRSVRFDITVKHVVDDFDDEGVAPEPGPAGTRGVVGRSAAAGHDHPSEPGGVGHHKFPKSVRPDLVSLPAYGISVHEEGGRDLLDFAATVYNGGPGPLVAEGFRRRSKQLMDAYQFFYRGEKQIGSNKVGTMEYDTRESHQHWHFHDFAIYDLVNQKKDKLLRTSGKEAFCLAPTDAIDLLRRGAEVEPGNGDLSTACGEANSVWVREVLAAGWGDTYTQQRAGQSIDITGLANGTYWIRITANPGKRLQEVTRKNNRSYRRVILGGTPGDRTVTVPKYGLIDSERYVGGEGPEGPVD